MVLIKAELEYRLWIPGKPKSLQSESKQAYRAAIQAAARQQFTTPLASKVELQVIFADKHSTRPDADIVLKPILDALTGVAFVDDKQVTKLGSYVLPMDESLRIAAGEPHHTYMRLQDNAEFLIRIKEVATPVIFHDVMASS